MWHSAAHTSNMFKFLVLCCLTVSCLAGPFGLESWFGEVSRRWRPVGCRDRLAGREACARTNGSALLAPHPYDCRLFFYCSNTGAPLACRWCPLRLHFNPTLLVCDWPRHANCTARPPPPRPRPSPSLPTTSNAPTNDPTATTVELSTTEAHASNSTTVSV